MTTSVWRKRKNIQNCHSSHNTENLLTLLECLKKISFLDRFFFLKLRNNYFSRYHKDCIQTRFFSFFSHTRHDITSFNSNNFIFIKVCKSGVIYISLKIIKPSIAPSIDKIKPCHHTCTIVVDILNCNAW